MNPYLKVILLLYLFFISADLAGQKPVSINYPDSSRLPVPSAGKICDNDMILSQLRKDPVFKAMEERMNREILTASRTLGTDTITLPVVVHIINQNPYSISDLQIIAGINDLNNAFSKTGNYSASLGVDTKIRFCISQKDPDGGNTTGITRTTSFFSNDLNKDIENAKLKNLIQWDPLRYINIWLITSLEAEAEAVFICGNWYRLRVGAYATMPPGGGPLDGIVTTGFGFVLAHEMGHYLGLYHTFTGGCYNANCSINGDLVCDTPPDGSRWPSLCNNPENSCSTDTLSGFLTDVPDQISNFMDYGNELCQNQFTQGQTDRMRAVIMTSRSGLLQDECTKPCIENSIAGFTRDVPYPVPGDLISFTNISVGAANYEWSVNGVVVSNNAAFSYTFNAVGKNKVTLKAFNNDKNCFAAYTDYVILNCGVTARFYANKQMIASKINILTDSILFTNTSYNGQTYQWLINNSVVSTNTNLLYVFPTPGTYIIKLVATNGACSDTTDGYTIPVYDPTPDGVPYNISLYCYPQNKVRVQFCIANYGFAPLPVNTPVNFYNGDPHFAGAIKLSPTFYLPNAVPGGNCALCFNHVLDVPYHGLEKIYLAFNDQGTAVPISFPNTPLIETNYLNNIQNSQPIKTTVAISICNGQNYAGYTASGTYIDTLSSVITGCDSVRTLILTIKPTYATTITTSICQGQNYAGHTASGTYIDTYSAANGCDSIRTLNLTVKPTFTTTVVMSICEGQNYYGHTVAGIYTDTYFATNGCDSTRTLFLTVRPIARTTINASICAGQQYAGHTAAGTYVDTYFGVNGCDSIRTLNLTVLPVFATTITASICQGENYAGHTTSGTYIDVYSATNGCDSTRTLHLTVNPLKFTTFTASICEGENYAGHTASGTYIDVYLSAAGCDSTRTLYLTVKPKTSAIIFSVLCEGENYAGHIVSGTYVDVYTGSNGCDSTRTLHLTVNPRRYTTLNPEICQGEKYFAAGNWQTATGVYRDTLFTHLGCDSVITTRLTVHPLPTPNLGEDRGLCIGDVLILDPGDFESYLWQNSSADPIFTTNTVGNYSVTVTNEFGCVATDAMRLLEIYPLPADFLPPDSSLCRGNILQIKVPGFINYNWSTRSTQSFIDITKTDMYRLQVTDRNDCKGTDSIHVLFYDNCLDILIPNAFTPNYDGKNDMFKPLIPAPVNNYHMLIFNRWGQQLFETQDQGKAWDGTFQAKEQAPGAYVYLITFKDIDRKNVKKYGTVILIR
jgi:gliding motility-associated-like protein